MIQKPKQMSLDFFEIEKILINQSSNLKRTYTHTANDVTERKRKNKKFHYNSLFYLYACLENKKKRRSEKCITKSLVS